MLPPHAVRPVAVRPVAVRPGSLARRHAPAAPAGHRPLAVAAALALLAFGANMASPLYPGYQAELGFDDLTLTLVYATYAAAAAPALLVLGPLGDRLGRVRLVRAGLVVAAAGSLCFALGDHPGWLFAGRVLQGVALGAATGAGMAVLAGTPPAGRVRRRVAAGATAFLAGTAAGPGLTGLLADVLPAPHATVHVLHVVALALVHHRLRPVPGPRASAGPARWPSLVPRLPLIAGPAAPARGPYLAATATGFVSWAVVGLFLGLVPSALVRETGGVSVTALGAVAAVVVLAALPAQAVVPRLGRARAQLTGLALLAGGLAVLATGAAALPVTLATAVVAGFGHGLAYGGAHGTVEDAARGDRAAAVTATAYVVYYLGAGLPTVAVGLLTSTVPWGTATGLLAAALLVSALATATLVAATAAGTGRRATDAPAVDDAVLAEAVDLLREAVRGVHRANGIWHGVPPAGRACVPAP